LIDVTVLPLRLSGWCLVLQAKMDVDESDSEEDDSSEETDEEPQNKKVCT